MKEVIIEGLDQHNPNNYGGFCSRSIAIRAAKDAKGFEVVAATDAPVLVMDWDKWRIIREVLPMRYFEKPENDKVPLLDSHSRVSVEKIKGSAINWRTEGNAVIATIIISSVEEDIRKKIEEKHIDSVSIGYNTEPARTVEIPKGMTVSIDGAVYKNDFQDDIPMVVRTWWSNNELSLVPIGADQAAKFRSFESLSFESRIENMEKAITTFTRIAAKPAPTVDELDEEIIKEKKRLVQYMSMRNALNNSLINQL